MTEIGTCAVCGTQLQTGLQSWHRYCTACGYESGLLEPRINAVAGHLHIDEAEREIRLEELRKRNFAHILAVLANQKNRQVPELLEVGSAHGWFLESASNEYDVLGIEPDKLFSKPRNY